LADIISLIPARGGSKEIPRKNIVNMSGKPLIYYSIHESLQSKGIDRTIVSTDDEEIALLARELGADVPFLRPKSLALDDTPDYPVIEHCLRFLENEQHHLPSFMVYLRPTMPLRTSILIDKVINEIQRLDDADGIRTVRRPPYPPYWMKKIDDDNLIHPFEENIQEFTRMRRQDLPPVHICDGYVDIARVSSILDQKQFPPEQSYAFLNEDIPFVDIDTKEDLNYCEYIYNNYEK